MQLMIRKVAALAVILTAAMMFGQPAAAAPSDCPISGTYQVSGMNPGGGAAYSGRVEIGSHAGKCWFSWQAPNTSSGSGAYNPTTRRIDVNFFLGGQGGVVSYRRLDTGVLTGHWYMNNARNAVGTETLTPISLGPREAFRPGG